MTSDKELQKWIDDIRKDLIYKKLDAEGALKLIQMEKDNRRRHSFQVAAALIYPSDKKVKCWEEMKLEELEDEVKREYGEAQEKSIGEVAPALKSLMNAGLAVFNGKEAVRMLQGLRNAFQEWDKKNIPRPTTAYILDHVVKEDRTKFTKGSVGNARKVKKPL